MKYREYTLPDGRKYRQPIPRAFIENFQINDESKPICADNGEITGYEKKILSVQDYPTLKEYEEYPYEIVDCNETSKEESSIIEKECKFKEYDNKKSGLVTEVKKEKKKEVSASKKEAKNG